MEIKTLSLGAYETNCYIIWAEGSSQCLVIDPGYEPERVLEAVKALGKTVAAILLTHGHFDHVGGVRGIFAETDCDIYLCPADCVMPEQMTHTSVVIAVSSTTETLNKTSCYQFTAESIACILTASVAVKDCSFGPPILLTELLNGIYTKLFLHIIAHFKSNNFAVETVENWRYIELAVSTLNFSNISQELFKRCIRSEISFYQVFFILSSCVSLCNSVRSAMSVNKSSFTHSAINCSEADMSATLCKSYLHPSDTVILVVRML